MTEPTEQPDSNAAKLKAIKEQIAVIVRNIEHAEASLGGDRRYAQTELIFAAMKLNQAVTATLGALADLAPDLPADFISVRGATARVFTEIMAIKKLLEGDTGGSGETSATPAKEDK